MSFWDDDRGLAVALILFMAVIVLSALFYLVANPAFDQIQSTMLDQSESAETDKTINERAKIWTAMPIYALAIAGLFLLARALFERRPG